MRKKLRLGVLASGSGTDLQSIIDACAGGKINCIVACVISDRKNAHCLERARAHGIPAHFVDPKCGDGSRKQKDAHEKEIHELLGEHGVKLVVGAGYMRILSPRFVEAWNGSIINIHPSVLPAFGGADGQGDAIEYGVRIAGCTTHFMDESVDGGPVILQAAVKVKRGDDRASLAERILQVEHQILPRTIDLYEQGRLQIEGRKVQIAPKDDSWLSRYPVIEGVLYPEDY